MTLTKGSPGYGQGFRFGLTSVPRVGRNKSLSAPLQRRRTLDEFPMDHSFREAVRNARNQRTQRLQTVNTLRKTCTESENLRQYSRRRFEYAVQCSGSIDSRSTSPCSTARSEKLLSSFYRPSGSPRSFTGPSKMGSVLYNRTPMILNTIRIRPQSEPPGGYAHLKKSYSDIRRVIAQSNCLYRVEDTAAYPDYSVAGGLVLVPLSTSSELEKTEGSLESGSVKSEHRAEDGEEEELSAEVAPALSREEPEHVSETSPASATTSATKLDENLPRKLIHVCSDHRKDSQPPSECSSCFSYRKWPHCWVDDVTVSSDESSTLKNSPEMEDSGMKLPETEAALRPSQELPAPSPGASPGGAPVLVTPDEHPEGGEAQKVDEDVEKLPISAMEIHKEEPEEEEEEEEVRLPNFICPSSELKSRQAATKAWLRSTTFTYAEKTVPLV